MAAENRTNADAASQEIRQALADLLERHEDCGLLAARILRALGNLEGVLRQAGQSAPGAITEITHEIRRRRNKPKRYGVQVVNGQEMLCEYRAGGAYPFRASKAILDAVVAVLNAPEHPLTFEQVRDGAGKVARELLPIYEVRVCLRFLMSEPPLVKRHRTRLAPIQPKRLKQAVDKRWQELPRGSDGGTSAGPVA